MTNPLPGNDGRERQIRVLGHISAIAIVDAAKRDPHGKRRPISAIAATHTQFFLPMCFFNTGPRLVTCGPVLPGGGGTCF
jgi:hypothetical protein